MKKRSQLLIIIPSLIIMIMSCTTSNDITNADKTVYSDHKVLNQNIAAALPGDTVVVANGTYNNATINIGVSGTKDQPITIVAETSGEVIFTGSSNLRIGGDYVIVDGLFFKDGFLDGDNGGVIEFRRKDGDNIIPANNSTVRNTVVAYYNNPDRAVDYKWVSMYGTYNTIEHSELIGKNHSGTALVVWRNDDTAQYHTIRYNKIMYIEDDADGNGAEAVRIGTSQQSLSDSFTTIEYNYFEQCNGETEVISNKSGQNIYRGNTFVDNKGLLTLRHGNNCTIDGNFFFGGGYSGSGGIRIIGEGHIVTNNYIENTMADGGKFRAAISITNGVENSPLNRYFQVKNAYIANNILVNNRRNFVIGAGADKELSLSPENVVIENNIVLTDKNSYKLIHEYAKPINITYKNNMFFGSDLGIAADSTEIKLEEPEFTIKDGLYHPDPSYGVDIKGKPVAADEAGTDWSVASSDKAFRIRNLYEEEFQTEVDVPWTNLITPDTDEEIIVIANDSSEVYVNNIKHMLDKRDSSVAAFLKDGELQIPKAFIERKYGKAVGTIDPNYITLPEIEDIYNKQVLYNEQGYAIIASNIELFKKVTSKDMQRQISGIFLVIASTNDGNVPSNTLDGDLSTRWSADGDGQWISYNLKTEAEFNSIDISFYKGDVRTTSFEVQISNDKKKWTTVYSGESAGKSTTMEKFTFGNSKAEALRLLCHGNSDSSWNSINEVQLFSTNNEPLLAQQKKAVDKSAAKKPAVEGTPILPTHDSYVELGSPTGVFGLGDKIRIKSNKSGSIVRIAYIQFDVSDFDKIEKATFQISGKLKADAKNPTLDFDLFGLENDDWTEETITWNNSSNHSMTDNTVLGVGKDAYSLGMYVMTESGKVNTNYADVTDFVKKQKAKDGIVTLMIIDTKKQDGNTDTYSRERSTPELRPYLIIK